MSVVAGSRPHDSTRASALAPIVMSAASLRLTGIANRVTVTRAIAALVSAHQGASAERVLLPGRRAEEEDERSRRPDGQQEGGGDEAPPQRRLVMWVGWWDRYAHSVPPPLSIDETELDGAGLRRPSFYYTTFRVK